MTYALGSGSLKPFLVQSSASEETAAASDWQLRHRPSAERILEAAQLPARASSTPYFSPRFPELGGGVGSTLCLAPRRSAAGNDIPVGPKFWPLTCTAPGGGGLPEFVQLFRQGDVGHLLTLGSLQVAWLPDGHSPNFFACPRALDAATFEVTSTSPQAQGDNIAWTSALTLNEWAPPKRCQPTKLRVERLHVAVERPGLLGPSALQALARWLCDTVPGGAPVAVLAEPSAQCGLLGQVAMTLALLHHRPDVKALEASWPQQRDEELSLIARQLYSQHPPHVASCDHISAVIQAHSDMLTALPHRCGSRVPLGKEVHTPTGAEISAWLQAERDAGRRSPAVDEPDPPPYDGNDPNYDEPGNPYPNQGVSIFKGLNRF